MYLVFDIGGTDIKYAYLDEDGNIHQKDKFSSKSIDSLDAFVTMVQRIYKQGSSIKGIALSCPGVIDSEAGVIEIVAAYPFLQKQPLTKILSEACDDVPVSLENDGKCAALAEVWIGNAKDCQDAIVAVFGTGIGGAIIKNKKVHHGAHRFAGEISTMITSYDFKNNHFVTWSDTSSMTALCKQVATALSKDIKEVDGYFIFGEADNNNPVVLDILEAFYQSIAIQLVNLQYVYDPEIICIGGGVSQQPRVLEGIQRALDQIIQDKSQLLSPKVTTCKYFNDANLIGALYRFKQIYSI